VACKNGETYLPLHVSNNQVLIIRRANFINTTSGICHSDNFFVIVDHSAVFRVTHTRGRIDTIDSPDDEHFVARNM